MTRNWRFALTTCVTFLRIPLVLIFFAGAVIHAFSEGTMPWLAWISFGFLVASALTDMLDGRLARKLDVVTAFGSHADPMTDKMFTLITLPLLVFLATRNGHNAHAVVLLCITVLFLARDQWVSFLRSIGAASDIPGHANWSGKLRTLIAFPMICVIYLAEGTCLQIPRMFLYTFEAVAVCVTLLSLIVYTRRYWPALRASMKDPQNGGLAGKQS